MRGFCRKRNAEICRRTCHKPPINNKSRSHEEFLVKTGLGLCKPAMEKLRAKMDFSEYGGAPLLGVNGVCIIGHGRSDSKAIQNAIKLALQLSKNEVNEHIISEVEKTNALTADVA